MDAREVICKILSDNNLLPAQFAKILGVHPTRIYDLQAGKTMSITEKFAKTIVENYPQYSKAWLMSGEGSPYSEHPRNSVITGNVSGSGNNFVAGNNNTVGTVPTHEGSNISAAEEIEIKETIVVPAELVNREGYDIKESYEDGTIANEATIKPTQETVPPHNMKVYTETDEMEPEIGPNDPIFISLMQSPRDVIAGRMYFIDLYQGAIVRWVFPQEDGRLLLRAANSATPELVVKIEEVKSVSKVVAILKRPKSMPVEHLTVQATLEHRDHQINEMLSQQGRLIGIIEKHQK